MHDHTEACQRLFELMEQQVDDPESTGEPPRWNEVMGALWGAFSLPVPQETAA